jgi:hypothetical protein
VGLRSQAEVIEVCRAQTWGREPMSDACSRAVGVSMRGEKLQV